MNLWIYLLPTGRTTTLQLYHKPKPSFVAFFFFFNHPDGYSKTVFLILDSMQESSGGLVKS